MRVSPQAAQSHGLCQVPRDGARRAARPHVARPATDDGAAVVQRRPARWKSGPHRSDGPRAQERHVLAPRRDGLQGDRGGLSLGVPAGLRLRAPDHRGSPDPRGRHDPSAHAVSRGPHPADLRVAARGEASHRPLLQLDVDAPAPRRLRPRSGRHHENRDRRRGALSLPRIDVARDGVPLRVLA